MPLMFRNKLPCTIITGFLGAGKTSLLNHLLKTRGDKSFAVVENEFGEVNIDRELVAENLLEKEDLVSLENGCVCCSLRKDMVKAFAEIERRSRGREKPIDAIIMETTGLADPAPVAFTFFANPWVASRFKLDSIMCVVDARYLRQHLEDAEHVTSRVEGAVNEAIQQIAFSDMVLLNKIDLVTPEEKAIVLAMIKKINSTARIIECQLNDPNGRPPIEKLLGINSFSIERALELDPNFLDSDSEGEDTADEGMPLPSPSSQPAVDAAAAPEATTRADASAEATATEPAAAGPGSAAAAAAAAAEPATAAAATVTAAATGHNRCATCGSAACRDSNCTASRRPAAAALVGQKHGLHANEPDGSENENIVKHERHPKRARRKLHDLSDISSVAITARGPMDEYRFNMYMRDLLAEKAKDIFRCKGVLCVHGYGSQKFVFQGVHETICYGPCGEPWKDEEARLNQVVFIGRGLDRKALIEGFRTCVWTPLPDGWAEFRDPTTKQPFFMNKATGEKSWSRPTVASAHVTATHTSTEQPRNRIPRRENSRAMLGAAQTAQMV